VIALIADDLTGASDAGVQFARRGLATRVLFDISESAATPEVDALVVDTDTRALPAADAYMRVREVADRLRTVRPEHVYKKVDSTLRGNLGAEIDAVMDVFGFTLAVVAPAFPALGRTTRMGIHHLRGRPVHQTEIGRDPKAPVRESELVGLVQGQSRRTAARIPLETVERGPESIRRQAEELAGRGLSVLVCDAESDQALQAIAESLAERADVLWVGSAGLAEHLAGPLGLPVRPPRLPRLDALDGPVLVVAGSLSETTQAQVSALAARPHIAVVEIDPLAIVGGDAACCAEVERCRHAMRTALDSGRDCALVLGTRADRSEAAQRVAELLGTIAADGAGSHRLGGLILTGGDTARAVCREFGATGIELLGEVEAGVPLGRLVGDTCAGVLAVTKAGTFGSELTLVRALDHLKGEG
jgi:uncharacterized protein YgbK (DUF1537 family)